MTETIHAEATFMDGCLRFRPTGRPSAKEIIVEIAGKHGLTSKDMAGDSKRRHIVLARHEAMWEVRQRTRLSLPQIGRVFGDRDHTTVGYGIASHCRRNGLPSPLGGAWKAGRRRLAAG